MTTTTSQYRLIAYKNGEQIAKSEGGEPVREMFENFQLDSADFVELQEKKPGEKRFRRIAVRSELTPYCGPFAETSEEATRVAEVAERHFGQPTTTEEFRTALEAAFEAGMAFGRANP